jgi:hypothetical protein
MTLVHQLLWITQWTARVVAVAVFIAAIFAMVMFITKVNFGYALPILTSPKTL